MQNRNRGHWLMLGKELFLKTDNRGRKQLTFLTWGLICLLIVCSSLLSQVKKPHYKSKVQQSILKEKDIIEAANSSLKGQGKSFNFDYTQTQQFAKPDDSSSFASSFR